MKTKDIKIIISAIALMIAVTILNVYACSFICAVIIMLYDYISGSCIYSREMAFIGGIVLFMVLAALNKSILKVDIKLNFKDR